METIKLTQDTLKYYFPSANITNCHHKTPGYPYDFVGIDSDTLLVTVGDSWTWGSGINGKHIDIHSKDSDQDLRRRQVWGHLVACGLSADWLNLGHYSQGNLWIADRVNDVRTLQPFLHYKKIIVVCVFTGAGRWFNTAQDQRVNHRETFKSGMTKLTDYDEFLKELNETCVQDILGNINSTTNMQLLMGTNMVEHLGFESLDDTQLLKTPWHRLLDPAHHSTKLDIFTDMQSIKYLPTLETLLFGIEQRQCFKKWMLDIIEKTEPRHEIFNNEKIYYEYHPLAYGHKVWANYVIKKLI